MRRAAEILVLSEAADVTAAEVISWLRARQRPCRWVHSEDPVIELALDPASPRPSARLRLERGGVLRLAEVGSLWWRQSALPFRLPHDLPAGLAEVLTADIQVTRAALIAELRQIPALGLPPKEGADQLRQLRVAAALGLAVPPTLVTTSRAEIQAFAAVHGEIITKRLDAPPAFTTRGQRWSAGGTRALRPEELEALEPRFTPALVQARVPAAFELRVFYLRGELFAMALLPVPGGPRSDDVRLADAAGAVRRCPYTLPAPVAARLGALMGALDLDTGSLDLIVTRDDHHVFLEVNPQGQLDWLSHDCGYHLEERIADALIALADGQAP